MAIFIETRYTVVDLFLLLTYSNANESSSALGLVMERERERERWVVAAVALLRTVPVKAVSPYAFFG